MNIDIKKLRALLNEKERMINEFRAEVARLNKLLQSTQNVVYKDPIFTTNGEND